MKYIFCLYKGDFPPPDDYNELGTGLWIHTNGMPIFSGSHESGQKWLLAGYFNGQDSVSSFINSFLCTNNYDHINSIKGQFILVIHSNINNVVKIYRDRVGILPLFYTIGKNGIFISSRLDQIVDKTSTLGYSNNSMLSQLAIHRFIIQPHTPYDSIKLLSGHHFIVINNLDISIQEIPFSFNDGKYFININDASVNLGEALQESVKSRLCGKDKLGAFLSGGLDSSLMIALARKYYNENIKTIYITYEEYDRDYDNYAKYVSNKYNTDHISMRLSPNDYIENWAKTISALKIPLTYPSMPAMYGALKLLSGDIKYIISGEGADTVFGGPYWGLLLRISKYSKLSTGFIYLLANHIKNNLKINSKLFKATSMVLDALGTRIDDYVHIADFYGNKEEVGRVFGSKYWNNTIDLRKNIVGNDWFKGIYLFNMLYDLQYLINLEVMLGFDNGIVFVYPFLDYDLIKMSTSIPFSMKYSYKTKKVVLKKIASNYFNKKFIYKPKEGFGVPLKKWFEKKEFEPFLNLPLEERSLRRGWWNEKELKVIIDKHKKGEGNDSSAESIPWITCNLELWARICVEGDSPEKYR